MKKSIFQESKICYLCGATQPLHYHHIFGGNANRIKSDEDGMTVWLCASCHQLVHTNNNAMKTLKRRGQIVWEGVYGDRKAFRKRYGRSYL